MHVDPGSLVGGFLLGGALWLIVIGVSLIRRGRFTPQAWANPHLSPRSQGQGFLLIGATFAFCGLTFLFFIPLGGVVLVAGIIATNLYGRRLQRRTRPAMPRTTRPTAARTANRREPLDPTPQLAR